MRFLWSMTNYTRTDTIKNMEVREESNDINITEIITVVHTNVWKQRPGQSKLVHA